MNIIIKNGFPVMLADVPDSGTHRISTTQKSGNDAHDTRSGKFAPKSPQPEKKDPPPNTDPNEYARMWAAVRDAARKLDDLSEATIRDFLAERASSPDQVDIAGFMSMVKQQRINDVVDALADRLSDDDPNFAIVVRDEALSASFNQLEPAEIQQIENVLGARGIDSEKLSKFFDSKIKSATGTK